MADNENTKKLHELGYGNVPGTIATNVAAGWNPRLWNPFDDRVDNPTFITTSFNVGTYTSPPMVMADVETVLGQWFNRLAANAGPNFPVDPKALTTIIQKYVGIRPALNTPQVDQLCEMADALLQACIAAQPK